MRARVLHSGQISTADMVPFALSSARQLVGLRNFPNFTDLKSVLAASVSRICLARSLAKHGAPDSQHCC